MSVFPVLFCSCLFAACAGAGELALVPAPKSVKSTGGRYAAGPVVRTRDASLPKEGYRLSVSPSGVKVVAADAAGEFYADVTLGQLKDAEGRVPGCEIEDAPAYAWRGALVDESRHFFGERAMKRIIDWMAYYKLNVLHWHLTDSPGWRIESDLYPELNKAGATRPRPDYCKWLVDYEVGATPVEFYTKKQLREIVAYAAARHVTIMPEIDFPGHSRAFNFAYPDLYCLGKRAFLHKLMWDDTHRHTEVVCLGNDKVVEMCENLVKEAAEIFPGDVIHIGGDECVTNTWGQCAKCQARIRNEKLGNEIGLQRWFVRRLAAAAATKGKRVAGWDEMMAADPPKSAIMHNWHAQALGAKAAAAGFDVIMSPNVETYLDYEQGLPDDPHTYPGFAKGTVVSLQRILAFDPMKGLDPKHRARVLGAEACNWTNCTPTEDELLWKMWPRQAAFAEAVWTAGADRDCDDFVRRLAPHHAKMKAAGMNVAPLPAVHADTPACAFRDYWTKIAVNPPPATRFAVDPKVSASGRDAYRVTEKDGVLSFVGSNVRSLHYAVYDFFQRKGCRWYWDEDALPAKARVETKGTDIREESRFEYRGLRYFAHRGLTRFQAEHWGPEDWKREIDWMLKNRLNLFMPRIGMDDTWQKAYPDIVPYPDASKRLPGAGKGYNDRSLFWSLEYRGKLRKEFTDYAYARGLLMPTDFGTMTHWYSRTPQEYLDKVKPAFLPQASSGYSEPSGLVFDVRDPKWYDVYWNLSEAYMKAGYGKPDLMHTIGLGERMVYTNRADNLALKIDVMTNLCNLVAKSYPDSKVLLAGWDFFFAWKPHEVRALLPLLDPKRTIVWDYEADARDDDYDWLGGGGSRRNDFTRWDVIGKFPYVFGIFLCYESGIDIRLDYDLIAKRQALIADDPMCKGYTLWPESSHTDILALEYFTANAWSGKSEKVPALLHDLCVHRYGADAAAMEKAWKLLLPMTSGVGWGENCVQQLTGWLANYSDEPHYFPLFPELEKQVAAVPAVYAALKDVSFATPAVRRDAIDVARTACDRLNLYWRAKLFRSFDAWTRGEGDEATVRKAAAEFEREAARLADLLALHTDYSIYESFLRLDAVEKIRYPDFGRTLLDNTTTPYCRSHQYEMVRHWYVPLVQRFTDEVRRRLTAGEKKSLKEDPMPKKWNEELNKAILARPLESLQPTSPRTREAFRQALSD